jgi:hypothetical protein
MVRSQDALEGQLLCFKGIRFEIIQCSFNEDRTSFLYKLRKTGLLGLWTLSVASCLKKGRGISGNLTVSRAGVQGQEATTHVLEAQSISHHFVSREPFRTQYV